MPIIGDTQLQPVNVLGSFASGMEMGRSASAARQQEAFNALKMQQAQQEMSDANALRAVLARGAPDDELLRTPGGAAILEARAKFRGSEATARGTELGNIEKGALLAASQAGAFLRDSRMHNKQALSPWIAQLASVGILTPQEVAEFDRTPDDPQAIAAGLQRLQAMGLTPAQQTEQTFTPQNLGGGVRLIATPTRGGGPATVVPGSQAAVTMTPGDRERVRLEGRRVELEGQRVELEGRRVAATESAPPKLAEPPAKLKPGEKWNAETGRIEAVPGSELYLKQRKAHSADFATVKGIETQRNLANTKIESLLDENNRDAFNKLFGGYNAYVSSQFSGKTANLKSQLDSLRSSLKTAGLQLIRQGSGGSVGQITEREWPILEGMIDTLTPTMEEGEARNRLLEIKTFMDSLATNATETYEMAHADSPFYKAKPANDGNWKDL